MRINRGKGENKMNCHEEIQYSSRQKYWGFSPISHRHLIPSLKIEPPAIHFDINRAISFASNVWVVICLASGQEVIETS
jgi:hypothetical protein